MVPENAPHGFLTESNPLKRQRERIAAAIARDLPRRWEAR